MAVFFFYSKQLNKTNYLLQKEIEVKSCQMHKQTMKKAKCWLQKKFLENTCDKKYHRDMWKCTSGNFFGALMDGYPSMMFLLAFNFEVFRKFPLNRVSNHVDFFCLICF